MKLKLKPKQLPPRTERVKLDGDTALMLDNYVLYFKVIYNNSISPAELLAEMATSFMKSDRKFIQWQQQAPENQDVAENSKISEAK